MEPHERGSLPRYISELQSHAIEDLLTPESIVVQPWGATEQHGPHLPVDTDTVIAHHLAESVVDQLDASIDVWLLPAIPYGVSRRHAHLAGAFSLSNETMLGILHDIGHSLARTPIRKLVFLNAHGGNRPFLSIACQDLRSRFDLLAFQIFPSLPVSRVERESGVPRHAGYAETSLMLHLAPERVDMSAIALRTQPTHTLPPMEGNDYDFGWLSSDLALDGILGDPTTASNKDGAQIFNDLLELAARQLRFVDQVSLPPRG